MARDATNCHREVAGWATFRSVEGVTIDGGVSVTWVGVTDRRPLVTLMENRPALASDAVHPRIIHLDNCEPHHRTKEYSRRARRMTCFCASSSSLRASPLDLSLSC